MRVLLAAFAFAHLGCQRVTDERADFGPEVSRAEVNRALAAAMSGVSRSGARVGSSVTYQFRRHLDNGADDEGVELGSLALELTGETSDGGRVSLKLKVDRRVREAGGEFKATREDETLTLDPADARGATVPAAGRVTYHRLRTATERRPAPPAVRARSQCGGLNDCELEVRFVIFDLVSRAAEGAEPRKVTLTLGFSHQTPYLPHGAGLDRFDGALVVECRQSTVPAEGREVRVRDCRTLTDFVR